MTAARFNIRHASAALARHLRHQFRLTLWRLLLLTIGAVTIVAQDNQPPACRCPVPKSFADAQGKKLGTIAVRVKAQLNQATSGLEWVLVEYPEEAAINIANECLKERIKKQVAALKEQHPVCGFGGDCRFNEELDRKNNDLDLINLPPELERPPADPNQTFDCTLCLLYKDVNFCPPKSIPVEIHVKTAKGATLAGGLCTTLGQAPSHNNRSSAAQAIPVKLAFAPEDLQNAKKDRQITDDEAARQRVTEELLRVSDRAFEIAKEKKMLDADGKTLLGCPGDKATQDTTQSVVIALRDIYDLNSRHSGVSWGKFVAQISLCRGKMVCPGEAAPQQRSPLCDNLCGDSQQPAWIILISGLQIVRSVSIRVAPDKIDKQFTRTATGRSLYRKRKEKQTELINRFRGKLSARPGHIITNDEVECDESKICHGADDCRAADRNELCSEIKEFKGLSSRPYIPLTSTRKPDFTTDANLIYEVLRKLPPERAIGLKGGGSFSPEEKFTANVGLDEQNMLLLDEQVTFDFARGPETQKLRFTLSHPFAETGRAGWRLKTVSANVQYFRDNDQRLGNLTAEEIAARETGSTARVSFGYDSFSAKNYFDAQFLAEKRPRTHWTMLSDVTLEYRDVNIPESDRLITITGLDKSQLPSARTQVTNLALAARVGMTRDFWRPNRAGLGLIALSLDTRVQRGVGLFGADYEYSKAWLSAHGEVFFGRLTAQDFFLRYTRGAGRCTSKTPVFELFRLGGPQSVRGIEEGELIGRRLTFGQAEFGISALSLWQFIRGNREAKSQPRAGAGNASSDNSGDVDEPPADGVDFSNVYLKTLFDHARISDPTSFNPAPRGAPPNPAPFLLDRRANGYGFAVELRNLPAGGGGQGLNLSIGYAHSPQSRLHRSGTIFTAVTFNF